MGRQSRLKARMAPGRADRGREPGPRGAKPAAQAERCGLCGKRRRLTLTECCGQPICDDEGDYVLFSYARNSCSRNHRRFTLCGVHHTEGHRGGWQSCKACRKHFDELEMYVYFGTNAYNFKKLENPPAYEPTHCEACGRVIRLGEDGYSQGPNGYRCEDCFEE